MNFKNMLNKSAMKLAFGYQKDGSMVSVTPPRRKRNQMPSRTRPVEPNGRQGKG